MRHRIRAAHGLALLLIVTTLLVGTAMAAGTASAIDWWSTSAGGGVGNSTRFTLRSSIGQHDAGRGTSESYTVISGVLAGSTVSPTTGEPPTEYSVFMPAVLK